MGFNPPLKSCSYSMDYKVRTTLKAGRKLSPPYPFPLLFYYEYPSPSYKIRSSGYFGPF